MNCIFNGIYTNIRYINHWVHQLIIKYSVTWKIQKCYEIFMEYAKFFDSVFCVKCTLNFWQSYYTFIMSFFSLNKVVFYIFIRIQNFSNGFSYLVDGRLNNWELILLRKKYLKVLKKNLIRSTLSKKQVVNIWYEKNLKLRNHKKKHTYC